MIRFLAGSFGRVPFVARLAGSMVGDPFALIGETPFRREQVAYQLPFRRLAMVNDQRSVETVMLDREGQFPKSAILYDLLQPLIGEGVFAQPGGDPVKAARRLVARALASVSNERIESVTTELTLDYMRRWLALPGRLPAVTELSRLTVDVVSECTMGTRFTEAESRCFAELFSQYHRRARPFSLLLARNDVPTRARIRGELGLVKIGKAMRQMIRDRFLPGPPDEAQFRRAPFLRALAEDGRLVGESLDGALDEIAVLLLAGHETTASTLCWLCHELASRPGLQDEAAVVVAGESAGQEGMARWQAGEVIDALTSETLRLYPPIGFFLRENRQPLDLDITHLPPGSFVMVSPRALHRHEEHWPSPHEFLPQRWLDRADAPPRTQFMPFGLGARICPGARFAGVELAVIARLLLTYLRLVPGGQATPRPLGNLTSRPASELFLNVSARRPLPPAMGRTLQ